MCVCDEWNLATQAGLLDTWDRRTHCPTHTGNPKEIREATHEIISHVHTPHLHTARTYVRTQVKLPVASYPTHTHTLYHTRYTHPCHLHSLQSLTPQRCVMAQAQITRLHGCIVLRMRTNQSVSVCVCAYNNYSAHDVKILINYKQSFVRAIVSFEPMEAPGAWAHSKKYKQNNPHGAHLCTL